MNKPLICNSSNYFKNEVQNSFSNQNKFNSRSAASLTSLDIDEIFSSTQNKYQGDISVDSSSSTWNEYNDNNKDRKSFRNNKKHQTVNVKAGTTEIKSHFSKNKIFEKNSIINNATYISNEDGKVSTQSWPCPSQDTQKLKKTAENSIGDVLRHKKIQQIKYQFEILYEDDSSTIINEKSFLPTDIPIRHDTQIHEKNEKVKPIEIIYSDKEFISKMKNDECCKSGENDNLLYDGPKKIVDTGNHAKPTLQKMANSVNDTKIKLNPPRSKKQNNVQFSQQKQILARKNGNSLKISEKVVLSGLEKQIDDVRTNIYEKVSRLILVNNIYNGMGDDFNKSNSSKTSTQTHDQIFKRNSIDSRFNYDGQNLSNLFSYYQYSTRDFHKNLYSDHLQEQNKNITLGLIGQRENKLYHRDTEKQNHNFFRYDNNFYEGNPDNRFYPGSMSTSEGSKRGSSESNQSMKSFQCKNGEFITCQNLLPDKKLNKAKSFTKNSNEESDISIMLKIKLKVSENEYKQIIIRNNDNMDDVIQDFCQKNRLDNRLKSPIIKNAKQALPCASNLNSKDELNKFELHDTNLESGSNEVLEYLNLNEDSETITDLSCFTTFCYDDCYSSVNFDLNRSF